MGEIESFSSLYRYLSTKSIAYELVKDSYIFHHIDSTVRYYEGFVRNLETDNIESIIRSLSGISKYISNYESIVSLLKNLCDGQYKLADKLKLEFTEDYQKILRFIEEYENKLALFKKMMSSFKINLSRFRMYGLPFNEITDYPVIYITKGGVMAYLYRVEYVRTTLPTYTVVKDIHFPSNRFLSTIVVPMMNRMRCSYITHVFRYWNRDVEVPYGLDREILAVPLDKISSELDNMFYSKLINTIFE